MLNTDKNFADYAKGYDMASNDLRSMNANSVRKMFDLNNPNGVISESRAQTAFNIGYLEAIEVKLSSR